MGYPSTAIRVWVHGWVSDVGCKFSGGFHLQLNRETTASIAYRRDATDYRLYPTRAGYKLGRNRDTPARDTNGGEGGAEPRHGGIGQHLETGALPVAFLNTRRQASPVFFMH